MTFASREPVDDLVVAAMRPMLGLGVERITRRAEDWPAYEIHLDGQVWDYHEETLLRVGAMALMTTATAHYGAPVSFAVLSAAEVARLGEPSRVIWKALAPVP